MSPETVWQRLGPRTFAHQSWYLCTGSPLTEVDLDAEVEYAVRIFFLSMFPSFPLGVFLTSSILSLPSRVLEQLCVCGLHPYKKWTWDRLLLVSVGEGQRHSLVMCVAKSGIQLERRVHVPSTVPAWCCCHFIQNYSPSKDHFYR